MSTGARGSVLGATLHHPPPTLPAPTLAELAVPVGSAPFPLCTVVALGASEVRLLDSTFTEVGDLSAAANVLFALCKRVTVRGCKIVSPPGDGTISKAWGGLHIAGGCSDILVERNLIDGGLGHGITLGSAHLEGSTVDPAEPYDHGSHFTIAPFDDCPSVLGGFTFETTLTSADDEPALVPDDGPHDLRIRRNRIRAMGGSGISVLGFWPEVSVRTLVEQIQTHDLDIDDNIIEGNCTHPPESSLPPALREVDAFGGVVLANADGLRVHDNLIRSNGADHRHPVCGVYVLHGENITVENNQIQDNGRRDSTTIPVRIDCGTAVSLAIYYTLVERLGAEAFNRLFYDKVDLVRLVNPKGLLGHFMKKEALTTTGRDAVFELRPGDIVYFRNAPEYSDCLQQDQKSGVWAGEWATFKGDNKFVGFGVTSEFGYDKIESDLHREAVAVCGSRHTITKDQVPGLMDLDGKAYAFRLDMQKIWLLLANNL